MPLLARLLGRRSAPRIPYDATTPSAPPPPPAPPLYTYSLFKFSKEQVRVLLFKESDQNGQQLLYDSATVQKVSLKDGSKTSDYSFTVFQHHKNGRASDNTQKSTIVEPSQGYGYQCLPPNADVNLLGEMIFGAVAMNFKGMSLKVHVLNSPERLMCTKVFRASVHSRRRTRAISTNLDVSNNNVEACRRSSLNCSPNNGYFSSNGKLSTSLDRQPLSERHFPTIKDDSGIYGDFSSQSSISSYSNNESSSSNFDNEDFEISDDVQYFGCTTNSSSSSNITNNLQWRLNRHCSTSLRDSTSSSQNSVSNNSLPIGNSDSQFINSEYGTTGSLSSNSNGSYSRIPNTAKRKFGLAIVINLSDSVESDMFKFLMEHAMLVEAALDRLRLAVQTICYERHSFITKMSIATEETAQWLVDVLSGPRLRWPLWLCLAGSQRFNSREKLANDFLRDMCFLLKTMDTKDTYFFMSTLITNVLTYHLGWVNSVSPFNSPLAIQQKELNFLNNSYPYNPLWAQIGELYGAIGTPSRISKTLIYSRKNTVIVNKILSVLSYFIRCSEVKRFDVYAKELSWDYIDTLIDVASPKTPVTDSKTKNEYDFNLNDDCIEMRTFSTNTLNDLFKDNNSKMDGDTVVEPKTSIKRTKSYLSSFQCDNTSVSNQNLTTFNSRECSENSVTSLVPHSEVIVNKVDDKVVCSEISDQSEDNCNNNPNYSYSNMNIPILSVTDENSENVPMSDDYNKSLNHSDQEEESRSCCSTSSNQTVFCVETQDSFPTKNNVLFVLGENEALIGLKHDTNSENSSKSSIIDVSKEEHAHSSGCSQIISNDQDGDVCCVEKSPCKHSKSKKHSGVKFEFDKYPQIVTNYMKSKNLELLDRHMIGKPGNLKIDGFDFESASIIPIQDECNACMSCSQNVQILQTPSNASELEFTSDMPSNDCEIQYAKEGLVPTIMEPIDERVEPTPKIYIRTKLENTLIVNRVVEDSSHSSRKNKLTSSSVKRPQLNMNFGHIKNIREEKIELPIPQSVVKESSKDQLNFGYCRSLMGGIYDHYVSDMVLQGAVCEERKWENQIRKDIFLQSRNASGGAAFLYANIDDWTVKVLGQSCGTAGMSTLVATMLDTLFHMYNTKVPAKYCLKFIESKLKEFCIQSKTLAELLLEIDFCDMSYLTKSLNVEPNDVPLLMAIASTHTPKIAFKYGVSLR